MYVVFVKSMASKKSLSGRLQGSSAGAYDLFFGVKPKPTTLGSVDITASGHFEQVVQKVENLMRHEEHRYLDQEITTSTETRSTMDEQENFSDSEIGIHRESERKAKESISKEQIMIYFSKILENCATSVVDTNIAEMDSDLLTSFELGKA